MNNEAAGDGTRRHGRRDGTESRMGDRPDGRPNDRPDDGGNRRVGYDCRLIWNSAWGSEPTFPRAVLDAPGAGEPNPYDASDALPDGWRDLAHRTVLPPLSVLAGRVWQLTYAQVEELVEHLYCCRRAERMRIGKGRAAMQPTDRRGTAGTAAVKAAPRTSAAPGTPREPDDGGEEQHRKSIEQRIRDIGERLRRLL